MAFVHLVDVLRRDSRLDRQLVGVGHDEHDRLARIDHAANRMHRRLVHDAALRSAYVNPPQLVLRRDLALGELADLAIHLANIMRSVRKMPIVLKVSRTIA